MNSFYSEKLSYNSFCSKINEITEKYSFIKKESIGQSALNKELFALTIGTRKKRVLFAAAFHGQEWITTLLMLKYIEELADSIAQDSNFLEFSPFQIKNALLSQGLCVLPLVNPDGVEIGINGAEAAGKYKFLVQSRIGNEKWQANARGIDLNHNFDAGFHILRKMEKENGIDSPAPTRYGGKYPHCEPETKALVKLIAEKRFEAVYAFHSQGEEIFYKYGKNTPAKGECIAKLLSGLSGYSLIENSGLYSHGGFKDYFIEKYRRPGFTFEIGKGENPLPLSELDNIYAKIKPALAAAMLL